MIARVTVQAMALALCVKSDASRLLTMFQGDPQAWDELGLRAGLPN